MKHDIEAIRHYMTMLELRSYDNSDPELACDNFERAYKAVEHNTYRIFRRLRDGVKTWHIKPRQLRLFPYRSTRKQDMSE